MLIVLNVFWSAVCAKHLILDLKKAFLLLPDVNEQLGHQDFRDAGRLLWQRCSMLLTRLATLQLSLFFS